jgi:hypothetical protein
MPLSGISSRGSGVKSMIVPDQDRRARKFEHIAGESSYLGPVLEQTRGVAAADSTVLSQRENRRKVRSAGFWAAPLALFLLPATVARAAYFPQIVLSGSGGFQSSALTNLFSGPAGAWSFGSSLAQPIFTGGRLRSGVRLAEAQQTAALFYQQSIQGAFPSVSDALVAYRKTREFRAQQELLFQSAEDAARLSHMRYMGGATGYLEVLTNETNAFSAELGLAQARLNELLALAQLYQALGGGSQQ